MTNDYNEKVNKYFDDLYQQHGNDVQSLGWSKQSQIIRFKVFSDFANLMDKSVLDVGCGLGHLAGYLKDIDASIKYTGYDINKKFIDLCQPGENIVFEQRNILFDPPLEKFDLVFSVGALNTIVEDNEKTMREFIKVLFDNCNELAAVSMLSAYVDPGYENEGNYYYNPGQMFDYAKTLTKKVNLIHDYLPHDFTLILKK